MRYACQLWGLCDNTTTHRILTLQKAALRLITFSDPRAPSAPIFHDLGILKLFDLVEVLNILLVHQHLNRELPIDTLQTLKFEKIHHRIGTRNNSLGLLNLPSARTNSFGLNSLTRLSFQQWNKFQRDLSTIELCSLSIRKTKALATKRYSEGYNIFRLKVRSHF